MSLTKINSSFVQETNPEVFTVSPRVGGALRFSPEATSTPIHISTRDVDAEFSLQLQESTSREFRIDAVLDETPSLDMKDATLPNPLRDTMYMFGVTISSIIMMAARHPNIPQEYYEWAEKCLRTVRDEFGNHPPNVQGMLNHINHLLKRKPDEIKNRDHLFQGNEGAHMYGRSKNRSSSKVKISFD